jgi:peroxiredoxin
MSLSLIINRKPKQKQAIMKHLLLCIGIMLIICTSTGLYGQPDQPMIGQPAPSFELKSLEGNSYSLAQWKGKLVMIHFATTWCPFCNAEAPNLETLYQSYKDKGVQVLIIDVKENRDLVSQTFKRFNFSFPVLLDEDGKVATSYAPAGVLPDLARDEVVLASNLIIDREGKIRFYSLLNTTSFDAKLISARKKLDELLSKQ